MARSDDGKPVRINLDDLHTTPGAHSRAKVEGLRKPPTTEELFSRIERNMSFLMLATGLLVGCVVLPPLAEKLLSEQANKKANPELPASGPVSPKCAGDLSQGRNDFEHLIAAPVNDQHVPEAPLDESKYPHAGKANP